jgi:hypothetical protein
MASRNLTTIAHRAIEELHSASGDSRLDEFCRKDLPPAFADEAVAADSHLREGRFQRSMSLMAGSSNILAGLEVSYEHYRGSYGQKIMWTPVVLSGAMTGAGIWCFFSAAAARGVPRWTSAITLFDSPLGFYFHVRGIARKTWAIAEGRIPGWGHGQQPEFNSHEAFCILNTTDQEAHLALTIYYSDRDLAGPYPITVAPRRRHHFRSNNLTDPAPITKGASFASAFESDVAVVISHPPLDSRQTENALMTAIAFPGAE